MNLATLLTMPHRPTVNSATVDINPFEVVRRQLLSSSYIVLVEPNGHIYRRISRAFDDTLRDRVLMAKTIRALRADAAGKDHVLRLGIERHDYSEVER